MTGKRKTSSANEPMFKFIMVGDSATGKSSLLIRYTKNQFSQQYNATIGIEFAAKRINIDENCTVKLQIWDTAGQQSFKSIVKSFYRNSAAVMLVFNICRRESFQSLKSWLDEARQNSPKTTIYVLVGTHLDRQEKQLLNKSRRKVSRKEAQQWMEKEELAFYFQTSSKNDINVSKAFEEVGKQIFLNALGSGRIKTQEQLLNQPEMKTLQMEKKKPNKAFCC